MKNKQGLGGEDKIDDLLLISVRQVTYALVHLSLPCLVDKCTVIPVHHDEAVGQFPLVTAAANTKQLGLGCRVPA